MIDFTPIVTLSAQMRRDLVNLAIIGMPNEVCGVIHTHNIIHQYQNVFQGDKSRAFDMEIDIGDPSIKAIWHSHPRGLERPSADDVPCVESLLRCGLSFNYIIVTPRDVFEFKADLVDTLAKPA